MIKIVKTNETSAKDFLPDKQNISTLRLAAKNCHGCHLYKNAKQTVFSSGPSNAPLMVIGEIPGKTEDETGQPFTGPAGMLLHQCIKMSGLNLKEIYFTNVVKHFKFIILNNRKIHRSPVVSEIKSCIPWLEAEIKLIQPKIILCLGLTAAKSLISKHVRIKENRGIILQFSTDTKILITYHPSAILRAYDNEIRLKMKNAFLEDIEKTKVFLSNLTVHSSG